MFSLQDKLCFININKDYLKYLHSFCSAVYKENEDGTVKHIFSVLDLNMKDVSDHFPVMIDVEIE